MTNQRNKPKPAPRSVDLAFKIGLPLLVVAAVVITFLPESRTALSPGVEPRGNASAKAPAAPEAAPPAPIPAQARSAHVAVDRYLAPAAFDRPRFLDRMKTHVDAEYRRLTGAAV